MGEPENKGLRGAIFRLIAERGPIPFAEFMDWVLYHPTLGYYSSPKEKIGQEGDYYTSLNIHPVFGNLIARQLHQMWGILGRPKPFTVAEMGAGKGFLSLDILSYCRSHWPSFYDALFYLLTEKSAVFEEQQRVLLKDFMNSENKVEWVTPSLLGKGARPFTGCLLSNELIDSFPVHRVQQTDGKLKEIYVGAQDDSLTEVFGPLSTPLLEAYLQDYGCPLQEGQRAEINLQALEWLEGVNRSLQRGFVLTLDYGFEAEKLYHPARPEGTLLCYFRHTTSSNPYHRLGVQDITAHVNFTALISKGESLGLQRVGFTEQYKFLAALGLLQDLKQLEKKSHQYSTLDFWKNHLAMRNFLIPGGMGTLFKVLAQSKDVPNPNLRGFEDPWGRKMNLNYPREKR